MGILRKSFVIGFTVALSCLLPLYAQTAKAPAATDVPAASPSSSGQASDEMTKKITELVRAGKYTEAQQLTSGLLVAYPDDQRLLKAKALIEKLLAPAPQAAPDGSQPVPNASAGLLTGTDKLEYNSLIELARQAQQTPDLGQQKASLQKFMNESGPFMVKHPDEMLLWELRAASTLSLDDPIAGFEAGQRLVAGGAADSNEANLQRLLAQINNKGWLGKEMAETVRKHAELTKRYGWMLGTWSEAYTDSNWTHCTAIYNGKCEHFLKGSTHYETNEEFHISKSSPVIEATFISRQGEGASGVGFEAPLYRGTLLDSGELRWEFAHRTWSDSGWSPWEWIPVTSSQLDEYKRTMTMIFPAWNDDRHPNSSVPGTHLLAKRDTTR